MLDLIGGNVSIGINGMDDVNRRKSRITRSISDRCTATNRRKIGGFVHISRCQAVYVCFYLHTIGSHSKNDLFFETIIIK